MRPSGPLTSLVLTLLISGSVAGPVGASTKTPLANTAQSDFGLQVTPIQMTVPAGGTATFNITVTSVNGFEGTVTVEQYPIIIFYVGGLPHNFTLTPGGWASYNVSVYTRLEEVGTFPIDFTGTSALLSHSASVSLTTVAEPDFTVSAPFPRPSGCSPFGCNINATAGAREQVSVAVKSYYNFEGNVTLSAGTRVGPDKLSFSLDPETVEVGKNMTVTSTLTILVPANDSFGGNWVFVNGSGGEKTRETVLNVLVPMEFSFTVAVSPLIVSGPIALSDDSWCCRSNSTLVTLSTNGFTRAMNFTVSGPYGIDGYLSPARAYVSYDRRTYNFTLAVSVYWRVSPGIYYVNLTGTSVIPTSPIIGEGPLHEKPEMSRSTLIPVVVVPAPPLPPPPRPGASRILGLEPVVFYEILGTLGLAVSPLIVAVVLLAKDRKSRQAAPRAGS